VQTAAVERLAGELPPAPAGPRVQMLSVDGAMVPLQHQEWAEVKTLAIGTVDLPVQEGGEWVVHTQALSYCSRLAEAETFRRFALIETHRRGTETAKMVCAMSDGAEWIQGFVDLHRPDAVRILDFPHAASALVRAGQAVYGEGTAAFTRWFTPQRHTLRHGIPQACSRPCGSWQGRRRRRRALAAVATVQDRLRYLEIRRDMLANAWCDARGYPIGSGSVESANKLVVERRLKGAGMHWARAHVNPMVALRAMACSDRWSEAWPQLVEQRRHHSWQARRRRQGASRLAQTAGLAPTVPPPGSVACTTAPAPAPHSAPRRAPSPQPVARKVSQGPYRPTPDHPWRRFRIRWKSAEQTTMIAVAKF
jgi:hypothetical protein